MYLLNNMHLLLLFLTTLILLIEIREGEAIKCFECHSMYDPYCADPFNNETMPLKDCSLDQLSHLPGRRGTLCRKIKQKFRGSWIYIRRCGYIEDPSKDGKSCEVRTGPKGIVMEYCSCNDTDGCNSN